MTIEDLLNELNGGHEKFLCEKQKADSTRMKGMKGITAGKRVGVFFHPHVQ
jgi:hypothetical protein